jgi:hypothetical protein
MRYDYWYLNLIDFYFGGLLARIPTYMSNYVILLILRFSSKFKIINNY